MKFRFLKKMKERTPTILATALWIGTNMTEAGVKTNEVEYREGDAVLEGYLAVPDDLNGAKRPGILLIHDWTGLQEFSRQRAEQLAKLGYVVFAADVYGKGVRPQTLQECGVQAGIYRKDRALFRRRLNAALEILKSHDNCDKAKLGAIGYCFGGTGVVELLRSGADIDGVVSFHGGLDSPNPEDGRHIKGKILVLHGADDPFVPQKNIEAFIAEMNRWKVDWQMISYSGAVHSFTKPKAGNNPASGSAYHALADKRSWQHMNLFFSEIFGENNSK